MLPADASALDNVAQLDGLPDGGALLAELSEITEAVGRRYDQLVTEHAGEQTSVAVSAPRSGAALQQRGSQNFRSR